MWIKLIFLAGIGLSAGIAVAAGVFALITTIGVVPRLIGKTKTTPFVHLYEWAIVLGGGVGNLWYLLAGDWGLSWWPGNLFLGAYGLFSGIFVGCLATSLAEALNTTAILMRRLKLTRGLGYLVFSLALGKLCGSLWQFFFHMAKTS
jgi:stage V sporulation protein AB